MVAVPWIIYKYLDPALEELKHKRTPIVEETVTTREGDQIHRDYRFRIINVGDFPLEHVELLLLPQSSAFGVPTGQCSEPENSENCVTTFPPVGISLVPAEKGVVPRVDLINSIPANAFIDVLLIGVPINGGKALQAGLDAAVSSDTGSASPPCVKFEEQMKDHSIDTGWDDDTCSPPRRLGYMRPIKIGP
jgi:hypothetical protein